MSKPMTPEEWAELRARCEERRETLGFGHRRRGNGPVVRLKPRHDARCLDCGAWVPNTASTEMRREGAWSHSHSCPPAGAERQGVSALHPIAIWSIWEEWRGA